MADLAGFIEEHPWEVGIGAALGVGLLGAGAWWVFGPKPAAAAASTTAPTTSTTTAPTTSTTSATTTTATTAKATITSLPSTTSSLTIPSTITPSTKSTTPAYDASTARQVVIGEDVNNAYVGESFLMVDPLSATAITHAVSSDASILAPAPGVPGGFVAVAAGPISGYAASVIGETNGGAEYTSRFRILSAIGTSGVPAPTGAKPSKAQAPRGLGAPSWMPRAFLAPRMRATASR